MKPTAIIINSYRTYDNVARCLWSVLTNTPGATEIVWVDCSKEPSSFVSIGGNLDVQNLALPGASLCESYNHGIRITKSPYIALLADDVEVTSGWLEKLHAGMERDLITGTRGIGMVTPMQERDLYGRVSNPAWRDNGPRIVKPVVLRSNISDVPIVGGLPVTLFCNLIRREVFDEIGIFDERFTGQSWCFDDDFQMRLHLAGWEQVLQTDCTVKHQGMQQGNMGRSPETVRMDHWQACQQLKEKWAGKLDWTMYCAPVEQWYAQQKAEESERP